MSLTSCIKVNFPFHLLEKLMDLRNEYLQADEANKRFLEQRYGKRVIQKALEEMESKEWLEKNSKSCPCCGTPIEVKVWGQTWRPPYLQACYDFLKKPFNFELIKKTYIGIY